MYYWKLKVRKKFILTLLVLISISTSYAATFVFNLDYTKGMRIEKKNSGNERIKGRCNTRWTTSTVKSREGETGYGYFNFYNIQNMVEKIQVFLTKTGYKNLSPSVFKTE